MYSKSSTKPLVADAMKQGARYILLIALCLLLSPGVAESVKVELDAGNSTSSASMLVIAYSNVEGETLSDSDFWSGSGMQYEGLAEAYQACQNAMCQSSAAASVSMSMTAHGASPEPGEQSIEGREIYDIRFYAECLAEPCPTQYPYTPILAGFSCQLNAEGSIVWELLPSTAEEMAGMPVIVFFDPVHYSVGGTSGGTVYGFSIYDWEYGVIGQEMEGPYEVASYADPPDYEVTPVPDWEDLIIHASIGDKIRLSYKMVGYGYTQDDKLVPSHLERDGDYPTMGLSLGVCVFPEVAVEISGPNFVVLYQPIEESPMETLIAQADEPGGAYQWEIIQGQDKARLFPEYGQATKIQGLAPSKDPNDVIIKVTYHSPDGKTSGAMHTLTVRRPSIVSIVDSEPNLYIPKRFVYQFDYRMQVSDKFGPIRKAGIPWDEERNYACYAGNKKKLIGRPINGLTNEKGQFKDSLWLEWKDLKDKGKIPPYYENKINQVFWIGGHELSENGKFCQTFYKDYATSTPGECACP